MTADEAIADITEKLKGIDRVLELGELNEEQFKEVTRVYAAGVILRAQFQASKIRSDEK